MRSVLWLAIKDLRLLLRDRMGLFFIVAFPVIMGIAFGFIGASFSSGPSRSNAMKIGIIDEDHTAWSQRFSKSLDGQEGIALQPVTEAEARERVRKRQLVGFVAIPKGFGATAGMMWADPPTIRVGVDPSHQAEAGMLEGFIMFAMGELVQERFADTDGMRKFLRKSAEETRKDTEMSPVRKLLLQRFLDAGDVFLGSLGEVLAGDSDSGASMPGATLAHVETVDVLRKPSKRGALLGKIRTRWDISFPAAMMWGVMACVAGFAVSIVKERTEGTLVRLKVAPIRPRHILGGKALACFLGTLSVLAFMTVLGLLVGLRPIRPDLLVLASVCIALGFVGLMMAMSVLGKTEQGAGGAAWAVIIVMCMFGGGMMPLAFLPKFMTTISHFSPVKWAILALEGAIWRDFSLTEMLPPCGVLLAIGLLGFATGVTVLSRQRD